MQFLLLKIHFFPTIFTHFYVFCCYIAHAVSQGDAQQAILQMQQGYTAGGTRIRAAMVTSTGCCWLAQKAANKPVNGYVKVKIAGHTNDGVTVEFYIHHLASWSLPIAAQS